MTKRATTSAKPTLPAIGPSAATGDQKRWQELPKEAESPEFFTLGRKYLPRLRHRHHYHGYGRRNGSSSSNESLDPVPPAALRRRHDVGAPCSDLPTKKKLCCSMRVQATAHGQWRCVYFCLLLRRIRASRSCLLSIATWLTIGLHCHFINGHRTCTKRPLRLRRLEPTARGFWADETLYRAAHGLVFVRIPGDSLFLQMYMTG